MKIKFNFVLLAELLALETSSYLLIFINQY